MTTLDFMMQRCFWLVIARDGAMPCRCGIHPYVDGDPCPKCWAWMRMEDLELQLKKTKRGRKLLSRPEPKWLQRCRKLARVRLRRLVKEWSS